jgi:hypothetical protein
MHQNFLMYYIIEFYLLLSLAQNSKNSITLFRE